MLLKIFQDHNDQLKQLVGKSYAANTMKRYKASIGHTREFIKWFHKAVDISINKLSYEFVIKFDFWFRTVRNCNHNTTIKYISNFRKVVNICVKNGWIPRDPFFGFKMNKKEVLREFFAADELQKIVSHDFKIDRLNQVRDIFVFACFIGLAYVDIKKLKRSESVTGVDGEPWIFTHRQ
jgi:site-specific recombinase XerD